MAIAVPMMNAADVQAVNAPKPARVDPKSEISEIRQLAAESVMSKALEPVGQADATRINLARAFDRAPTAMSSFSFLGGQTDRDRAIQCLAEAAYFEAGNDIEGQRAVMQVVLNRVRHPVYPSTVCGVVFEGSSRKTGCQFTFTCDGSRDRRWSDTGVKRARKLAAAALDGYVDKAVGTATHYHADYVVPYWSGSLAKIAAVGQHLFYTFPHRAGSRAYFRAGGGRNEPVIPGAADIHGEADVELVAETTITTSITAVSAMDEVKAINVDAAIFQLVDPSVPSGRWAVTALNSCADRSVCEVFAYTSQAAMQADVGVQASQRRPAFTLHKDIKAGIEQARWNCQIAARSNPAECLSQ